jgi:hypothetical protein
MTAAKRVDPASLVAKILTALNTTLERSSTGR